MKEWQPDELVIEPELCQQIIRNELDISMTMQLVNETVMIVNIAITDAMLGIGGLE
jgi:hypothetical protein